MKIKTIICLSIILSFFVGIITSWVVVGFSNRGSKGPFKVEQYKNDLVILLRGKPVLRVRDEMDHYKFFLTGEDTPFEKAVVRGSIDAKEILYLTWEKPYDKKVNVWSWQSEDDSILSEKHNLADGLMYGDSVVGQKK